MEVCVGDEGGNAVTSVGKGGNAGSGGGTFIEEGDTIGDGNSTGLAGGNITVCGVEGGGLIGGVLQDETGSTEIASAPSWFPIVVFAKIRRIKAASARAIKVAVAFDGGSIAPSTGVPLTYDAFTSAPLFRPLDETDDAGTASCKRPPSLTKTYETSWMVCCADVIELRRSLA